MTLPALLVVALASAFVARKNLRVRSLRMTEREMREIERLKDDAVTAYFKEGSISRENYDTLMREYETRMTKLEKRSRMLRGKLKKKAGEE